jgi:hypothetical protein
MYGGVSFAFQLPLETDMFNSSDEPGAASDALAHGDYAEPTFPPPDVTLGGGIVTDVDLRSLPAGTEVVVDTCRSRYRFVMLDGSGRNAQVEGGPYFPQEVTARVEGSTLGRSLLKLGWIGLGWCVELSFGGKRIITSRVRSISIEGSDPGQC